MLAALRRAGFEQVSQRGSHIKLRNLAGRTAIVPNHTEIARGTMRSILRQADLTLEDSRSCCERTILGRHWRAQRSRGQTAELQGSLVLAA